MPTMCGYCTENIALDIVEQQYLELDISHDEFEIALGLHLQEMDDLKAAIQLCGNIEEKQDANSFKEMILCRLIMHLFQNGFDHKYQSIVETESVRSIIQEKCTPNDALKKIISNFCGKNAEGVIAPLYDEATLTDLGQWQSFITSAPNFIDSYTQVSNHYHKWWYLGENLQVGENYRESDDGIIIDGLFERHENACTQFVSIFRSLVFSILLISEQPGPQETVEKIIQDSPRYMPDFTGLDLWLQRIAVSRYYNKRRQEFYNNLTIRMPLIWYFAFDHRLGHKERGELATRLEVKSKITDKDSLTYYELLENLESLKGLCEISDERRRLAERHSYLFDENISEIEIDD